MMQYKHRRLGQSSKMSEEGSQESDSLSHSGCLPSTVLVADLHYAQKVHNAVAGPQIALLGKTIDNIGKKIDKMGETIDKMVEKIDKVGENFDKVGEKIDKVGEKIGNLTQRLECGLILFFAWCCFDVYKRSTKGDFQTPTALSVLLLMNIAQDE